MQDSQVLLSAAAPPLISFIVPCYNVPVPWLVACVRSILDLPMDGTEREIIVVDDGSVQPVEPSLRVFGEAVRCVRQENGGLSEARNTGIRLSRGTYIQFVDADDRLLPRYSRCVQLAREGVLDMICFRLVRKDEAGRPSLSVPATGKLRPVSGVEYMLHHNLRASACGYLFRRALLGSLRFAKGMLHEDEEFTPLLMLKACAVCDFPFAVYFYRTSPHSITRSTSLAHVRHRLDCKAQIILRLRENAAAQPSAAKAALLRRSDQLSMDLLLDALGSPLPASSFRESLARWRRLAILPLSLFPCHTLPYMIFALASRCRPVLCIFHVFWSKRRSG